MIIDKTNLRALMRRLRYLEFMDEHRECRMTPDVLLCYTAALIGDIAFKDCRHFYHLFSQSGKHFKDSDLLYEWLMEVFQDELQEGLKDETDEYKTLGFKRLMVQEGVREAKAELKEAGISMLREEIKGQMKQFVKEQLVLSTCENITFSVPALGQLSGMYYFVMLLMTWLFYQTINFCNLLRGPYNYDLKIYLTWQLFPWLSLWSELWKCGVSAMMAPFGVAYKWAACKFDVWSGCGIATYGKGRVVFMSPIYGPKSRRIPIPEAIKRTKQSLDSGSYSPDLQKIRQKFKERLDDVKGLKEKAVEAQKAVNEEMNIEVEKTKGMNMDEFDEYMKKRDKEREKLLETMKESDTFDLADLPNISFSDYDLMSKNEAFLEEMKKEKEKREKEKEGATPDGPDQA